MNAKVVLRQHAVIPRSITATAFGITVAEAASALGMEPDAARDVLRDLPASPIEHVQTLLASKGMTLTLIPAVMSDAVKSDSALAEWAPRKDRRSSEKTVSTIASKLSQISSARTAANSYGGQRRDINNSRTLKEMAASAASVRLSFAVVSAHSAFADCSKVSATTPGTRRNASEVSFFDGLVAVALPGEADGFRSRPDLHVAALFDRMYFAGASMRIAYPDGEECDAYTTEDVAAAVSTLMGQVDRVSTAKALGLSLPMYDALATRPGGHRTSTLLAFMEKAGASVNAVRSDRQHGWATQEVSRPSRLSA